jgi:RNase P subunit RPR2
MKIVKENPFQFKFTCRKCKSKLVAEAEDVCCFYLQDEGYEYRVICPNCGAHTFVPSKLLTPKVIEMAQKKGDL